MDESAVSAARTILANARHTVILTGAGVSAESGVPTFRGEDGLWESFRPEELATPEAFARDPRLVWKWYAWRRERVAACRPNAAHRAIARFALEREGVTVVTQNVDGLHEAAALEAAARLGSEPVLPVELHGAIFRVRCTACGTRAPHRGRVDAATRAALPRCGCGALLRPDIVWFGEALPAVALRAALEAAAEADVCLVVGTSGLVYPAAGIPAAARRTGARVIEVNPEPTPLSALADVALRAPAAEAVPAILQGDGA